MALFLNVGCDIKFKALGCFHDNLVKPRPLPDLILTERDPTSRAYNGRRIDWKHWERYLPEFVCRCARRAKELQHEVFGVQFYGKQICRVVTYSESMGINHPFSLLCTGCGINGASSTKSRYTLPWAANKIPKIPTISRLN